ncbi:MAG: hypothetical protein U0269_23030 [Polyangiales bacterium]
MISRKRALALLVSVIAARCGPVDEQDASDVVAERSASDGTAADVADVAVMDAVAVLDASATDATDATVDAGDASAQPDAMQRPFGAIAWESLGAGVSFKQTDDSAARNVAVLYAGYNISAASSQRWAEALYDAWMQANRVRYVYAVQGPAAVDYRGKEIANRAIAASLVAHVDASTEFVAVIAHSSGAYVAAEGFYRLFVERPDRGGLVRDRVLYFDLDGDWGIAADPERNLSAASVGAMRWAYFIAVSDPTRGLVGFNSNAMRAGQAMYPTRSEFAEYDARDSGCSSSVCLHLSLINTRPPGDGNQSYSDFAGRPVNRWYLDRAAPRLR